MRDNQHLTLEEKIDLILEYQQKAHRHARFRLTSGIIFFIILIGLPLLGIFWFTTHFQEVLGVNPEELRESLNKVNSLLNQFPE